MPVVLLQFRYERTTQEKEAVILPKSICLLALRKCILITYTNIRNTFSNVRKKEHWGTGKAGRPWVSCELTELEVKLERRPRIII